MVQSLEYKLCTQEAKYSSTWSPATTGSPENEALLDMTLNVLSPKGLIPRLGDL